MALFGQGRYGLTSYLFLFQVRVILDHDTILLNTSYLITCYKGVSSAMYLEGLVRSITMNSIGASFFGSYIYEPRYPRYQVHYLVERSLVAIINYYELVIEKPTSYACGPTNQWVGIYLESTHLS